MQTSGNGCAVLANGTEGEMVTFGCPILHKCNLSLVFCSARMVGDFGRRSWADTLQHRIRKPGGIMARSQRMHLASPPRPPYDFPSLCYYIPMPTAISRRCVLASLSSLASRLRAAEPKLRISLAEWSFHKAIESRLMTNLDFPRIAREQFNIEGLEFVNGLWEAPTQGYVQRLKSNMEKTGTKGVLIMCDDEGAMGHSDRPQRMQAAMNHRKWVDIAAELGCHSIRTNMYPASEPTTPQQVDEFIKYCAESFTDLCGYARTHNLNVIIENHGGISS